MTTNQLKRELGVISAVGLGLSSIIGTGVFVSIGIAAQITGPSVILAICLACFTATCNALNSAQLAAAVPVSGGTYEYGYQYVNHWFGFIAGWMFLCAKSASAASAALGFSSYLLGIAGPTISKSYQIITPISVGLLIVLTVVVLLGIRLSNVTNYVIISFTLLSLLFFIFAGIPSAAANSSQNFTPFFTSTSEPYKSRSPVVNFFEATALMFVAFTGYGRIATLGEEVINPRRTIPIAIIVTLVFSATLYISVSLVAVASAGVEKLAITGIGAPLINATDSFVIDWARYVLFVGAITSMMGVLLNLLLGLSRMVLSMSRRRDVPVIFSTVHQKKGVTTPTFAVLIMALVILCLILIGNLKTTWSFSAFTVLIYYSICNIAALRMPINQRLYSKFWGYGGLLSCLVLAFFIDWQIWVIGLGMIVVGCVWHAVARWYVERESKLESARIVSNADTEDSKSGADRQGEISVNNDDPENRNLELDEIKSP
ncbi:amino acid/polyamine transporter I [Paraphysoderma sedebokerense]|nr:amino acid/polyamine transporter I [Paraphysoderma sedebokerense]